MLTKLDNLKLLVSANYVYKLAIILVIASITVGCEDSNSIKIFEVDETQVLSDEELAHFSHEHEHEHHTHAHNAISINFGFDLRSSPQEDAKQYMPFLEYLEKETGYQFNLKFTPKNSSTAEELGKNKIQLSAMGAVSFIKANQKYQVQLLVRGVNKDNTTTYQSFFVVDPLSSINSINELRGKSIAFGSIDSTQGHIIPRIEFQKHNISLRDFSNYQYTGSHRNCAEAVISKQSDVCAMQDQMAQALVNQGLLKVIYISDHYPSSGIVANNSLSKDQIETIKKALLNFDPKGEISKELYHWDRTEMPNGFAKAYPEEYGALKKWIIKYLLNAKNGNEMK